MFNPGAAARSLLYSPPPIALILAFGIPIVGALTLILLTIEAKITPADLDADRLYTFALLQDIFVDGGRLSTWNLGQHSDFFPDKMLAAVAFFVTRKVELWLQVYAALIVAVYFGTAWYFFVVHRRALHGPASSTAISLLLAFAVTALPLLAWNSGLFVLFLRDIDYPSHHYAASLCGVLGALVAIDAFDKHGPQLARRLAVSFVILFLVTVSDKITVPVVAPGFFAAMVFYAVVTRRASAGFVASGLCVSSAVAIGFVFGNGLNNMVAQVTPMPLKLQPASFVTQLGMFTDAFLAPGIRLQLVFASLLIGTVFVLHLFNAVTAMLVYLRRKPPLEPRVAKGSAFVVYLTATAVVNPIAIIAVGQLWTPVLVRLTVATFFCAVWAAAAQLDRLVVADVPRRRLATIAAAAGVLLSAVAFDPNLRLWNLTVKVPLLQCLRHFEGSYGLSLRRGLGYYWDTMPATLFSNGQVTILTAKEDARIWHWVNNLDWYAPRPDNQPFTFLVLDPEIDHKAIEARFGAPAYILDCSGAGHDAGRATIWAFAPTAAEGVTSWITEQYREAKKRR